MRRYEVQMLDAGCWMLDELAMVSLVHASRITHHASRARLRCALARHLTHHTAQR